MKAGADCVFIPGLYEAATIGRAVKEIEAPINILAHIKAPTVKELKKLGVARLSIGSGAGRAAWGVLREISHELLDRGTYSFLLDAPSHAEMNTLLAGRRKPAKAKSA
jgi:2-methylisocitrate lyase-like PEP mutase family enzyme